jgi:hypothetical protein
MGVSSGGTFLDLAFGVGILASALAINWLTPRLMSGVAIAADWLADGVTVAYRWFASSSAGVVVLKAVDAAVEAALKLVRYALVFVAISSILYLLFPLFTDTVSFLKLGYWETTTILERLLIIPPRESFFGWVGLLNIVYWFLNLPSFLLGLFLGFYLLFWLGDD